MSGALKPIKPAEPIGRRAHLYGTQAGSERLECRWRRAFAPHEKEETRRLGKDHGAEKQLLGVPICAERGEAASARISVKKMEPSVGVRKRKRQNAANDDRY